MPKKHVYREGDEVRIVNPVVVLRVGYPFDLKAVADQIGQEHYDDIHALLDKIEPGASASPESSAYINLTHKIAYIIGRRRGMGGRDRQLWTEVQPDLVNHRWSVTNKRTAMTGRYFSPTGSYDDYIPGGLDGMKQHVLLHLHRKDWLGDGVWIEQTNVEPVLAPAEQEW